MDLKGRMNNKFVRKGIFKDQHFDSNCNFLYQEIDRVTEKVGFLYKLIIIWILFLSFFLQFFLQEKIVTISNVQPIRDLSSELIAGQTLSESEQRKVLQLKDILEKILALDPSKRLTPAQALSHPFITEKM